MIIKGLPDVFSFRGKKINAAGNRWIGSSAPLWGAALKTPSTPIEIDLSDLDFVTLFEWVTVISLLEKLVADQIVTSNILLDLIGDSDSQIIPPNQYILISKGEVTRDFTEEDFVLSDRIYRLTGFLESLGTRDIINHKANRIAQIFYKGEVNRYANLRSGRYAKKTSANGSKLGHKVVLRITRIEAKDNCKIFLDDHQIRNWKEDMGARFHQSPLFESEELWRVLCHELAVNIWEHAKIPGFIACRVVETKKKNSDDFKPWLKATYGDLDEIFFHHLEKGFLELCVADAGVGIVNTLKHKYIERTGLSENQVEAKDVLMFAFDEFGTCKSEDEQWATERHALARILHLVAKYGGVLKMRSGGAEVVYKSKGGRFNRLKNNLGYEPSTATTLDYLLPGTQLQILLPLIPLFDSPEDKSARFVLNEILPQSFRTQEDQVRGHLVPLLEVLEYPQQCIGKDDQRDFRKACVKLNERLMKRPQKELFVLDFGGLEWNAFQFETLLHLLQNILQNRPVLLVEIRPELANEVARLEKDFSPTQLRFETTKTSGAASNTFGENPEKYFLETYNRVHATVLGVDQEGNIYIFGLSDYRYQEAILSLTYREASIEELCRESFSGEILEERVLRSILTGVNPLFFVSSIGNKKVWRTVLNVESIRNETSRVVSRHFDEVANRSRAWRGKYSNDNEKGKQRIFHLPWLGEWREDFLESSRILSRGRQVDEIAQRLIYRLKFGLELMNRSIDDVKVLVGITTPGMLLAFAIHKWWTGTNPPAVADLGYYVMLNEPKEVPAILNSNGVVVIQDILDTHIVSGSLIQVLQSQDIEILCLLGFIQLASQLPETRMTSPYEGWVSSFENGEKLVPRHALLEVTRPESCSPPDEERDDKNAFWVEPRSLKATRYQTLRREFRYGRDPLLDRRDECLQQFDNLDDGCLFLAGHYAYGRRHYMATVNIPRALLGGIGDEIAHWVADKCEGEKGVKRASWETDEGFKLEDEVTTVLMPLHSQIHYLWNQVENLLAQRGRRQPNWWLEAALFVEGGSAYYLPEQFRFQIEAAVKDCLKSRNGEIEQPLRIFIIDDAIATGRTAENILTAILREVEKHFNLAGVTPEEYPSPIKWIRYFAFLNQMDQNHHDLWHNLPAIGKKKNIQVVFEEYAPFMGGPIYNEGTCPYCVERKRLKLLINNCEQKGLGLSGQWAKDRHSKLRPIAIDNPDFKTKEPRVLSNPVNVVKMRREDRKEDIKSEFFHADSAIWRFYELMNFSYPPNDVLQSLKTAWTFSEDETQVKEYERYRWALIDWCFHNWHIIKANSMRQQLVEYLNNEVSVNTSLVEPILEAAASYFNDPYIIGFVVSLIDNLTTLENERSSEKAIDQERINRVVRLSNALPLFFLGLPDDELKTLKINKINSDGIDQNITLIEYLENSSKLILETQGYGLLRSLYWHLTRPERHTEPAWALKVIAEALYRGRSAIDAVGNHLLLPKLVSTVASDGGGNKEDRRLLYGSLSTFLFALEDLKRYSNFAYAKCSKDIEGYGKKVLKWLEKTAKIDSPDRVSPELHHLKDAIDPNGEFCELFNNTFHYAVADLIGLVDKQERTKGNPKFSFIYSPDEQVKQRRVLTDVERLCMYLSNLTIDPSVKSSEPFKSLIKVHYIQDENKNHRIQFRLLTNFADKKRTTELLGEGRNNEADRNVLEEFGAHFNKGLLSDLEPSEENEGYLVAIEFDVMSGFEPKGGTII